MNGSGSVAGQGYGPRAKKKEQELELAKREYDSVRNINLAKIDIQNIKFSKTDSIMKKKIENKDISRKDALKKIGKYGKYTALTALGTYLLLSPQKAQAASPEAPGTGF